MIWNAFWIWTADDPDPPAHFFLFRRQLTLRQRPRVASAFCTASQEYQLFVNGRRVGRGPAPGDPRWQPYDSYDLTPFLARGPNVIAAVCFHDGRQPAGGAPGGFLFQAALANGVDAQVTLVSDERWRACSAGEWHTLDIDPCGARPRGEVCDLRHEPRGWLTPEFDDSAWQTARVLGPATTPPWRRLVPRQLPPPLEEEVVAVRILSQTPDHLCLDFGRIVVGYPRVRAGAAAEGNLELVYGDWVDAEGRVTPRGETPPVRDRLVLPGWRPVESANHPSLGVENGSAVARRSARRKGAEPVTWQPFGRRAFRYLEATLRDGHEPLATRVAGNGTRVMQWDMRPGTVDLSMLGVGYPVEERGAFRCSDALLDEVWLLGRETLRRAMQEQFEKCPATACFQTVADTRAAALANIYAFGDYRLLGRAIWQLAISSEPGERPDDDALWVLLLSDYFRYTGDDRLVRQLFPHVRARLAWLRQATNEHGLVEARGARISDRTDGRLSVLESLPIDLRGEVAALNALYLAALRAATELACRGLAASASSTGARPPEYEHRARTLERSLNWSFWSEGERAFADGRTRDGLGRASPFTNWLLLYLDAAEPGRRGIVLRRLMANREAIVRFPPAFQLYVAETLFREGCAEDALDLIRAVWGEMLRRGATTCWEYLDWDAGPTAPPRGSLCHAASAVPTYLLPAKILGVAPRDAGWGQVRVRVCPAGLTWAEGTVPTLRGSLGVSWRRLEDGFELFVELPPRLQAWIDLPVESDGRAEWDGRVFWPTTRADRGLELEAPVEQIEDGLRVRVTGPRQVTLRARGEA